MIKGKALYSVAEVLESNGGILPMSKSAIYKLIRDKEIPSKHIGGRVFIPGCYFDDMWPSVKQQSVGV